MIVLAMNWRFYKIAVGGGFALRWAPLPVQHKAQLDMVALKSIFRVEFM